MNIDNEQFKETIKELNLRNRQIRILSRSNNKLLAEVRHFRRQLEYIQRHCQKLLGIESEFVRKQQKRKKNENKQNQLQSNKELSEA